MTKNDWTEIAYKNGYEDGLRYAKKLLQRACDMVARPLTVEELSQMEGEPVWIEFLQPGNISTGHWRIWHRKEYFDFELEACGKEWAAYRKKPCGNMNTDAQASERN